MKKQITLQDIMDTLQDIHTSLFTRIDMLEFKLSDKRPDTESRQENVSELAYQQKENNLKCPFCNKPLQPTLRQSDEYWCENYDCPRTNIEWVGSQKLWQELIRTRKALDVAVDALKYANKCIKGGCVNWETEIDKALDQIQELDND